MATLHTPLRIPADSGVLLIAEWFAEKREWL